MVHVLNPWQLEQQKHKGLNIPEKIRLQWPGALWMLTPGRQVLRSNSLKVNQHSQAWKTSPFLPDSTGHPDKSNMYTFTINSLRKFTEEWSDATIMKKLHAASWLDSNLNPVNTVIIIALQSSISCIFHLTPTSAYWSNLLRLYHWYCGRPKGKRIFLSDVGDTNAFVLRYQSDSQRNQLAFH